MNKEHSFGQLWYLGSPNCVLVANARSQVSPHSNNQRDVAAIAGWLRLEVGKHFSGIGSALARTVHRLSQPGR